MLNCRSISPEVWEHARQALIMYFSRRHRFANAEDLAQETLAVIWSRDDFEFNKEDEFLRVCYGFASRISLAGYRAEQKHDAEELDPTSPHPGCDFGLRCVEARLMLDEVVRVAQAKLRDRDWQLIRQTATGELDTNSRKTDSVEANRSRVNLFRARKKLKELTGWGK
jgi:hypothetical protein